jgi:DNA-directed RNA polymerase subunit M/transcription elongation factor TFIIS
MQAKVCKNCLQPLSPERKERGLFTCANCSKLIQAKQQQQRDLENPPPTSPLQAALKNELQKQAEAEAEKKELEKKQKNVEHFFDDLQKVKRSFW